ncbi:MAG: extracytoplasmic sigma factor ECF [Phycisphaerae bacterium]|nr:MAG: extracytoplasmic sigma factor ECF [Phycisphaerae bacterium]
MNGPGQNDGKPQDALGDATLILARMRQGDARAAGELFDLVYENLRSLAHHCFKGQNPQHTLQPTALVHEAFAKLAKSSPPSWEDRAHFFAVAATAMRQILKDYARGKRTLKRAADGERVTLSGIKSTSPSVVDIVALDDVLSELADLDERQARIVELRFFGGLTVPEVGKVLELSTRTIENEWRRVRAWLSMRLREEDE